MKINIRFGSKSDYDISKDFDRFIQNEYLIWKLNNNEILLAEQENQIVGYLRLEYLWTKTPYIGLIIVLDQYRRQGVGKLLLNELSVYLKNKGHDKLYSSSQVNESDPQNWHRHMGFKETGIINGINDGIGEVIFVLDI